MSDPHAPNREPAAMDQPTPRLYPAPATPACPRAALAVLLEAYELARTVDAAPGAAAVPRERLLALGLTAGAFRALVAAGHAEEYPPLVRGRRPSGLAVEERRLALTDPGADFRGPR